MRRRWGLLLAFFVLIPAVSLALTSSPHGDWTSNDETGKPRAIIRINVSGDTLSATIVDVYPQPGDIKVCNNCPGEFKDKPIKGLRFAWGLKNKGNGEWEGGQILDPQSGKIYRAKMSLKENKLHVRGYLGASMFGRTQVWVR